MNQFQTNLCPRRGIWKLCQYQMDDVGGKVTFTAGDKNLGPADLVCVIPSRDSLGLDVTEVTSSIWLSEAHCASPLSTGQLGKEHLLHLAGSKL
jgi:hypothetical protein